MDIPYLVTGGAWAWSYLSAYMGKAFKQLWNMPLIRLPYLVPCKDTPHLLVILWVIVRSSLIVIVASDFIKRHVTRQKILNWKQSLKFPSRPQVSHEGINLMQQLLCEPEDRLGSQASSSVSRPNSMVIQARRSGFVLPNIQSGKSVDGAEHIKVVFFLE